MRFRAGISLPAVPTRLVAALFLLAQPIGCGGGGAALAPADATTQTALDAVRIMPGDVTLQVGASVPLTVVALGSSGDTLVDAAVTLVSSNSQIAITNPGGVLQAVGPGTATITASASRGGVTRTSTITVTVTSSPVAGGGAPAGGLPGTAVVSISGTTFVPGTVNIAAGGTVTWQFSGATHNVTFGVLKPASGDIPDTAPGSSVSRSFAAAGTYAYQCTRHSNMTGTVVVGAAGAPPPAPGSPPPAPGAPPPAPSPGTTTVTVTATANAFTPEEVEVPPGSTVTWEFSGVTNNVTFKDEQPPGGNVPNSSPGTRVSRTFPTAGDYDYFSTVSKDMKGRIRVR